MSVSDATSALRANVSAPRSAKQQALRKLNDDTSTLTKALSQAQTSIAHAIRTVELDYQKRRTHIINAHNEIEDQS